MAFLFMVLEDQLASKPDHAQRVLKNSGKKKWPKSIILWCHLGAYIQVQTIQNSLLLNARYLLDE